MRLAWFSPVPPVPSGIALCTAELVAALASEHEIDVYVDEPLAAARASTAAGPVRSAHDFVWRHHRVAYDLTVYQVGNSSHHDFLWPYLFRYPGLAVLHDAHLHHARAAALLRTKRADDYRAEFAANHPDANVDLAELAVAGFDNHLYYAFPMTRLVAAASRLTVTHAPALAADLKIAVPAAHVEAIHLAHGTRLSDEEAEARRARACARYDIAPDALIVGVIGGLTPEKRLPQVIDAFAALLPYAPAAHLLLAGGAARHYDCAADIRAHGIEDRVTMTGYVATEDELTDCVAACDISVNLRWPTAREMSGPWLRALAAARPTIVVDLAHLVDVPSLDPRTWSLNHAVRDPGSVVRGPASGSRIPDPGSRHAVTIAVDILDEDHSLRLALRRLATDPALRRTLGRDGRDYWDREHSMTRMLDDYRQVLRRAAALPAPRPVLPDHLVTNGDGRRQAVLREMMLPPDAWSRL